MKLDQVARTAASPATPAPTEAGTTAVGVGPERTRRVRGGGGVTLHVSEWGRPYGPPLLFVHGWSQSQLCWARQVAGPLARDHRIVTLDNRGHGMSDKPLDGEQYRDPRLWADDVAAVIDQMNLDRPVLVGWSYGGYVVTDFIRVYGEDAVAGINLVGAAVVLQPPTFDHLGPGLLEHAEDVCSPDLHTSILGVRRLLEAMTAEPLDSHEWSNALCSTMVVPAAVRSALLARQIDADDVLAQISVPVLVTHGRADTIVLPSMAEHVLEVCKSAEPSWYEGVGHMPFIEDPARFDRELGAFVARVRHGGAY
jgi:non-heme chloroperoxidase